MRKLIERVVRELNWSRRQWSTASDRAFHEGLYQHDDYDPFSPSYPGNTTIRRFADLVEPRLPTQGLVLDLGCGPGEITCELAARRSDLTFLGIDHSPAAIAKARANVSRRRVSNITFDCFNVEDYDPPGAVALATLFDSFHHLIDPAGFVKRLHSRVQRWALIEPRGSWAGTWQKDLDFDWLAQDLDNIRAHVAANAPLEQATVGTEHSNHGPRSEAPASPSGQAVERRYTVDDFERFFEGLALDFKGTVAGLEAYPAGGGTDALRERFGEIRYLLYRDVDDWLFERGLDLHAKHWLIVAERGGRSRAVTLSSTLPVQPPPRRVAGAFDVRYGEYRGPHDAKAGEKIMGACTITNDGWDEWSSEAGSAVFASYHWLDSDGRIILFDGDRTPLPRPIGPGVGCEIAIIAKAPASPGRYRLAIDLVRENVTWFSQAGHPCLEVPFRVLP